MYVNPCEILKVVDGDTLDLVIDLGFNISSKRRVTLDLDAPEHFGPNASQEGKESTDFVKDWVAARQRTPGYFMYHSKVYDKYGRSMGAIVFINTLLNVTESLNEALLETKHAVKI